MRGHRRSRLVVGVRGVRPQFGTHRRPSVDATGCGLGAAGIVLSRRAGASGERRVRDDDRSEPADAVRGVNSVGR